MPFPQKVLCFEGGGLRGLAQLLVLKQLMQELGDRLDIKDLRPCEVFTFICGSYGGGILALLVGRMEHTVDEAIDRYLKFQRSVVESSKNEADWFSPGDEKFDVKGFEDALHVMFPGDEPLLHPSAGRYQREGQDNSGKNTCRTAVSTTIVGRVHGEPIWLRSYTPSSTTTTNAAHTIAPNMAAHPWTVYEAARATSGSSHYLDAVEIAGYSFQGGFASPCSAALLEVARNYLNALFQSVTTLSACLPVHLAFDQWAKKMYPKAAPPPEISKLIDRLLKDGTSHKEAYDWFAHSENLAPSARFWAFRVETVLQGLRNILLDLTTPQRDPQKMLQWEIVYLQEIRSDLTLRAVDAYSTVDEYFGDVASHLRVRGMVRPCAEHLAQHLYDAAVSAAEVHASVHARLSLVPGDATQTYCRFDLPEHPVVGLVDEHAKDAITAAFDTWLTLEPVQTAFGFALSNLSPKVSVA